MAHVLLVTPTPPDSLTGNAVTARRWARIIEGLGFRATIAERYDGQPCDLLVALHARLSAPFVKRYHKDHPERPLILALTGTDLYNDIEHDRHARHSLEIASHLIVLQEVAPAALPPHLRGRARVIYQSVTLLPDLDGPPETGFDICVLAHLRSVKDPFRVASAVQRLPASSEVVVRHCGAPLDEGAAEVARATERDNPRYRWLGPVPHQQAVRMLARSHLHVLTSKMEGASNAISEALALGVPTLATDVPGCVGMLGRDYRGLFPVGDTGALADLINRAETDPSFYEALRDACDRRAPLIAPEREASAWADLLAEVGIRDGKEAV